MPITSLFKRTARGIRENRNIYLISTASLAVAFLCLATALLASSNLVTMQHRWSQNDRLTVFLRDDARSEDVRQLQLALQSMTEFRSVRYLSSEEAKKQFLKDSELDTSLAHAPTEAFPASLELHVADGVDPARLHHLKLQIAEFPATDDVETYEAWFGPMKSLLSAAQRIASVLALLVALCVIAVVANTVRLAVHHRAKELHILKLCGATNRFVRAPLLLEGAIQGLAAASLALVLLGVLYLGIRPQINEALAVFAGMHARFLGPGLAFAVLAGSAAMGILGSLVAVRRYLREAA